MTDTPPADATDAKPADETDTDDTRTGDDPTAEVERLRAELQKARKWEERAKANAQAAKELEEFRKQSMTETEKAIEEARTEGRRQALTEAGAKIAAAELRAAASGRMTAEQMDTLLDGINLARFVDDDGEVDRSALTAFVDGIAPQPTEQPTVPVDLGQGTRNAGQHTALNGDPLLADLKSKLGVR